MPDHITDDEAEAIANHIAKHGVTRVDYMVATPVPEPKRLRGLVWGKGTGGKPHQPKKVRPVKRIVKP